MRYVIPSLLLGLALLAFIGTISNVHERRQIREQADAQAEARFNERLSPQYDREVSFRGVTRFYFEINTILLCLDEAVPCRTPISTSGMPMECWVENKDKDKRHIPNGAMIEGVGRVATRPGGFGHMNLYECQLQISEWHIVPPHP
ncbi:hypothetical protein FJQ54_01815 [Sandaracinobacter neustonicus]|uniref:Uncharacterized protein n=1 Tax=Sandaracinobacter neustonicus TaxID=1715348 RepID=A0A501XSS4_9SPHN|nr:hypothetical protein [Sandaracinobacter neustonicus]TPE63626.1 hypothetical protein FJQ54_01815 [Sandaracinobacter neustonicus]